MQRPKILKTSVNQSLSSVIPFLKQSKIILFASSDWFRVHGEGKAGHGIISPISISGEQEDRARQVMEKDTPAIVSVQSHKRGNLPEGKKGVEEQVRQGFQITVGEWKLVL